MAEKKWKIFGSLDSKAKPAVVTWWSLVHVLAGASARGWKVDPTLGNALHALYESYDYRLENRSGVNGVADQAFFNAGYFGFKQAKPGVVYLWVGLAGLFYVFGVGFEDDEKDVVET